ncbi:CBASS cGAMP-activated phospholipase [Hymenobacter sp. BT730]|uniref:CBASS cGAMP-activated phospholipase n=1 Tax=Hymenobacter sp. BT730 TaxID=3063332 RepID=UPI0026E07C2C|nr:CBASS cGAMP-activated phospholipase [Hymenobacter sp. BT730]
MSNTFKILSLDGGGIKGLYTAKVLSHLEEVFGGPIGDYFDMICGTSTGGLIALALSQRIPASQLVTFYKEQGPKIFPVNKVLNEKKGLLRQIFGKGKYTNTALASAIMGVLGDAQMSDAQNLLCIPSFNLTSGRPRVFKFPHPEGNNYADKYGSMYDAALATSAAPTYFPVKYTNGAYYADGGVWANNPTLCGIMEALEYFVGPEKVLKHPNLSVRFDSYSVLSIACLPQQNGWAHQGTEEDLPLSFIDWKDRLFETSLDGQSHFADNFAQKLIQHTKAHGTYHRIGSPTNISPAQQALIKLDNSSARSIQTLEHLGNMVGDDYRTRNKTIIDHFFAQKKKYRTH